MSSDRMSRRTIRKKPPRSGPAPIPIRYRYKPAGVANAQKQSGLFRLLPPEIRRLIFRALYQGCEVTPHQFPPHRNYGVTPSMLAPFLVCRQMYTEAVDAFYYSVRLVLESREQIQVLRDRPRNDALVQNIRNVKLQVDHFLLQNAASLEGIIDGPIPPVSHAQALAALPQLRSVVIGFGWSVVPTWTSEQIVFMKQTEEVLREEVAALAKVKSVCVAIGWPRSDDSASTRWPANTTVHRTNYQMNGQGVWEHYLVTERRRGEILDEQEDSKDCCHCHHELVGYLNWMQWLDREQETEYRKVPEKEE